MKNRKLTIDTVNVEIRAVRVGGHKMTKAVFQQIEEENPMVLWEGRPLMGQTGPNGMFYFYDDSFRVLGYVRQRAAFGSPWSEEIWVLFVSEGKLKRWELHQKRVQSVLDAYDQVFICT